MQFNKSKLDLENLCWHCVSTRRYKISEKHDRLARFHTIDWVQFAALFFASFKGKQKQNTRKTILRKTLNKSTHNQRQWNAFLNAATATTPALTCVSCTLWKIWKEKVLDHLSSCVCVFELSSINWTWRGYLDLCFLAYYRSFLFELIFHWRNEFGAFCFAFSSLSIMQQESDLLISSHSSLLFSREWQ